MNDYKYNTYLDIREDHPLIYEMFLRYQKEAGNPPNDNVKIYALPQNGGFKWRDQYDLDYLPFSDIMNGETDGFYEKYPVADRFHDIKNEITNSKFSALSVNEFLLLDVSIDISMFDDENNPTDYKVIQELLNITHPNDVSKLSRWIREESINAGVHGDDYWSTDSFTGADSKPIEYFISSIDNTSTVSTKKDEVKDEEDSNKYALLLNVPHEGHIELDHYTSIEIDTFIGYLLSINKDGPSNTNNKPILAWNSTGYWYCNSTGKPSVELDEYVSHTKPCDEIGMEECLLDNDILTDDSIGGISYTTESATYEIPMVDSIPKKGYIVLSNYNHHSNTYNDFMARLETEGYKHYKNGGNFRNSKYVVWYNDEWWYTDSLISYISEFDIFTLRASNPNVLDFPKEKQGGRRSATMPDFKSEKLNKKLLLI